MRLATARDELLPQLDADLSAHRVDTDIFGWNKDFTEMAAIGSDIFRYPKGKQRGEAFLLVFDIDSVFQVPSMLRDGKRGLLCSTIGAAYLGFNLSQCCTSADCEDVVQTVSLLIDVE